MICVSPRRTAKADKHSYKIHSYIYTQQISNHTLPPIHISMTCSIALYTIHTIALCTMQYV